MKRFLVFIAMYMVSQLSFGQELQIVHYQDGSQAFEGMITSNHEVARPGVLILPAWKGIDDEAREAALKLTAEGYIALIADIYGVGNTPQDNASASKMAGQYKQDYKSYQHRIRLALDQLTKHGAVPDRIAVIGYCFGGTGALEAARGNLPVAGVISIHGGLAKDPNRNQDAIKPKVLVEHPAADKSVSQADYDQFVKEMDDAGADWQIITYAQCGHTFTNPASKEYNALMAKRAWDHTVLFLKELLQ